MISNAVQNILNTIRDKSVQKGLRDMITRDKSVNQFSALDYGDRIETGIKEIQAAESSTNSIGAALPLHIYVPPGTHTLTAPITITRHNVTLSVDGGARIIPPSNQAAIVFDGPSTTEGYIKNWGLFMHGVIWPTGAGGASQHGVIFRHAIHGTAYINEIRALGGSALYFDGANFSNKIDFNRLHGCVGWGIQSANDVGHAQPFRIANLVTGEIQACTAGAANFLQWYDGHMYLRVENFSTSLPLVVFNDSHSILFSGYFENPSNLGGDDIKVMATTSGCEDLVFDNVRFHEQKDVGSYNINLVLGSVFGLTLRQIRAGTIASRFLFIGGGGNTKITKFPEANYQSGAVTNNAGAEYKSVTIA